MSKKLTTTEFIKRANKIHNYKYDYSKVNYTNAKIGVKIICPIHGKFTQTPDNHLHGKGCKHCANNIKHTTQQFITQAKQIHKDKYIYDKCLYKDSHTKVIIKCKKHGYFEQSPTSHLSGNGCSKCAKVKISNINLKDTSYFINKSNKIHNNKYSYTKSNYIKSTIPLIITCPIHGDFLQRPTNHLRGVGCPSCGKRGWSRTEWINFCKNKNSKVAYLYVIQMYLNSENFIKIGITKNSVKTRFNNSKKYPYKYKIVKIIENSPGNVFDQEITLHNKLQKFKITPSIIFKGYTECYSLECLSNLNL